MRIYPISISALALLGVSAKQSSESELLKLSCLVYDDLSFYDLRGLRSDSGYTVTPNNGVGHNYTFNLCSFISEPCNGNKVFGCKDNADGEFALTSGSLDNLTLTVEESQNGMKFV